MNFSLKILVFATALILTSCVAKKKVANQSSEISQQVIGCKEMVTVRNYTHESDCQYLLELSNGKLLYPVEMPKVDVPFYDGANLQIGYELISTRKNDQVSIQCSKHDYMVRINCMKHVVKREAGLPATHEECKSIKNPYKFTWMRDAIARMKPTRLNEYKYTIGYLYEFVTKDGSILFDCLGNQMCTVANIKDCESIVSTLSSPKVILVVNN